MKTIMDESNSPSPLQPYRVPIAKEPDTGEAKDCTTNGAAPQLSRDILVREKPSQCGANARFGSPIS
jgi:hypothetical protein